MMKICIIISLLVLSTAFNSHDEIKLQIIDGKKEAYSIGDEIKLLITVYVPSQTCVEGLKQIKIFQRGVTIIKQIEWSEKTKEIWQKEIILEISGNKKAYGLLTIMRRADKQSFLYHERFPYKK